MSILSLVAGFAVPVCSNIFHQWRGGQACSVINGKAFKLYRHKAKTSISWRFFSDKVRPFYQWSFSAGSSDYLGSHPNVLGRGSDSKDLWLLKIFKYWNLASWLLYPMMSSRITNIYINPPCLANAFWIVPVWGHIYKQNMWHHITIHRHEKIRISYSKKRKRYRTNGI